MTESSSFILFPATWFGTFDDAFNALWTIIFTLLFFTVPIYGAQGMYKYYQNLN